MVQANVRPSARVLVIDDNRAIHDDFRKILTRFADAGGADLTASEANLFGLEPEPDAVPGCEYELDSAYQGHLGYDLLRAARLEGRPYMLAFVDIRMPPGWDGVQTIARLWEEDPNLQTVICTAYSDYSWKEVIERLGRTDRLLVLKKPFDPVEVRQLACAMVQKWHLMREAQRRVAELEAALRERSQELHARNAEVARLNAELAIARRVALRPEGARQLPGTSVPG